MSFNLIASYLKKAEMMVLEPTRQQSRPILKKLRDHFGIDFVKDPEWREYLTYRKGTSNKFHYFAVLKMKNGQYAAANVYGRIGYPKFQVKELGRFDDKAEALNVAKKKLNAKKSKGYETTKLA